MRKCENERNKAVRSILENIKKVDNDDVIRCVSYTVGYYLLGEHGDKTAHNVSEFAYVTQCMVLYEKPETLEKLSRYAEILLRMEVSEQERGALC